MKILFWALVVISIPVGLFVSFVCLLAYGIDVSGTAIGEVVSLIGIPAVVIAVICAVLGILKLRKGHVKKALAFAVAGVAYSVIILAGVLIEEAVYGMLLDKDIAAREEQMYGENWDAAPAMEGIPELYQDVLNRYYAVVRDRWPADELMGLGALAMADYYGDESLDNIGFALMDLNGDNMDELVIGAADTEGESTVIFCIYADQENPHYYINSVENQTYYLHAGETEGTYMAEIVGFDAAWIIEPADAKDPFDFTYWEGTMDPADRMMLDLIPFSRYK